MAKHYLEPLFAPSAIAVFGADDAPGSVGGLVCRNLIEGGFAGPVYPINPTCQTVNGLRCFAGLDEVDGRVDLAVIVGPAEAAPGLIRACGLRHVPMAIVLSGGFRAEGLRWRQAMLDEARRHNLRLLGPNCLGLLRPAHKLNASFSRNRASAGPLALVSQSGAICTAILDWASERGVGFSSVVSAGDACDIGLGDLLDYLALDPATRGILMYIEGVRDARRFMSGLRAAARVKPLVVVKAGRHAEGARAAMTHTGALVGEDDVFNAALERAGAVRVRSVEQMFAAAQLLATPNRVDGNRLAIVSNAGGPAVLATDAAVERGIALAALGAASLGALDAQLPKDWSRGNPLDLLGEASPSDYRHAAEACLADAEVDGLLAILTPQAMAQSTATAEAVADAANPKRKPILACWLGGPQVAEARTLFARRRIPSFANPESAVEAFGVLAAYRRNQQLLLQTPGPLADGPPPDIAGARLVIEGALDERRTVLSFWETRAVLHAFNIPALPALTARSAGEALAAAESLGFPLAMKICSPDITHKSEVGGVRLNIHNAQAVRQVYGELLAQVQALRPDAVLDGVSLETQHSPPHGREVLVGIVDDPLFGPVLSFGAGGTTVEILHDRAIALPPLNAHLARAMIAQTKTARLLGAFRHLPPACVDAVVEVLLCVSAIACELPEVQAMDINPLLVDEHGAYALDTRILVRPPPPGRRFSHMAIHPYPSHLESACQLADGTLIILRPIRPEDAALEQDFVRRLSPEAKYFRFMETLSELSHELLVRFTQLDYARELAFVASVRLDGAETLIGVARYFGNPDGRSGEIALAVADAWQNKGIATRLMGCLIDAAREQGFHSLEGEVLANNAKMLRLMDKLGFGQHKKMDDPGVVGVEKRL
ncbi:MAG: bifunctional acetate--CoA ligase family protein/GNAT family N-acetyltransferase [Candidatus Methylumidiphilus sp.]